MKKTCLCLILLFLGMEMMPVKGAAIDRNNYAISSDTSALCQSLVVDTFSHMNNTRGFLSYNMQELSLRQGPTIGETLGRIPGIQHLSFGPNVGLPVIRSLSGHRVSILADGLSVSNLSGISPTFGLDIDQDKWTDVEISKHSASVLYGGGAIGGAVNMHSQLVPMQVPTGYVTGSAILDFGSNSGSRLSFSLNGRIGQHYLWHIGALYHHEKEVSIPGSTKATLANDTSLMESNPVLQRMMQRSVVTGRRLNYTLFPYISESGRWNIDPAKQNYDDLFTFQSEEILSGKTIQNTPNPLYVPGQDPQRDRYVQIPHQFVDYGTVEYQKIPNSYRRGNAVETGMSYVSQHVKVGAGYQYHHSNYGTPLFARTLTEVATTSLHAQDPNAGRPEDYVGVNARNNQHIGRIEAELLNVVPYFPMVKLQGLVQYANDQELLGSEIGNQFKTHRQNTRFELHQQRLKFWTGITGADFIYQRMEGEGSARYLPNHQSLGWGLFSMQYFDYQFIHASLGYRHEQVYRKLIDDAVFSTQEGRQDQRAHDKRFALHQFSATLRGDLWKVGYLSAHYNYSERAPEINELYAQGTHFALLAHEQGDETLQKESAHQMEFEAGVLWKGLHFSFTFYDSYYKNYLYLSSLGFTPNGLTHRKWRAANTNILGFETALGYDMDLRSWGQWSMNVFYDWVKNKEWCVDEEHLATNDAYMPHQPISRVGCNFTGKWRQFTALLDVDHYFPKTFLSQQILPEYALPRYTMMNARLGYTLEIAKVGVEFYLYGKNLLNEDCRPHYSLVSFLAPLPGINIGGGMKFNF